MLDGVNQVQSLPLDLGSPIVYVSSADPYLIALTEDGQLILLSLETSNKNRPEVSVVKANLKSKSRLVTACAYKDISGLFTTEVPEELKSAGNLNVKESSSNAPVVTSNAEIDDEDELLYGESAPSLFEKAAHETNSKAEDYDANHSWKKFLQNHKPTYWALIYRENGNLEIMSLPDFTVKYLIQNLNNAPNVLTDALFTSMPKSLAGSGNVDQENLAPKIQEISLIALGERHRRPLFLARTSDHELLVYEAYPFYDKLDSKQLKIRFKKVQHGLLMRERKSK